MSLNWLTMGFIGFPGKETLGSFGAQWAVDVIVEALR